MDNTQEENVNSDEIIPQLQQENQFLLRKLHDVVRRYRSLQEQYQCLVQQTSIQGKENQIGTATEGSPTKISASLSEQNLSIKKLEDEKHTLIGELKRVVGTCRVMHKQLQEAREENERLVSPNKPLEATHKSPSQREAGSFRLPIPMANSPDSIAGEGEALIGLAEEEGILYEGSKEERNQFKILLQENEELRRELKMEKEKAERSVLLSCEKVSELEKTLQQVILARDSLRQSHYDEISSLQQRIDQLLEKEESWETEMEAMVSNAEAMHQQLLNQKTHSTVLEKELLEGKERTANIIKELQVELAECGGKVISLEQERDIYALQVSEQQETINEFDEKYQMELSRSSEAVSRTNDMAAENAKRQNEIEAKLQDALQKAHFYELEIETRNCRDEEHLAMRLNLEREHREKLEKMREDLSISSNASKEESLLRVCEIESQLQELRKRLGDQEKKYSQEKDKSIKEYEETLQKLNEGYVKELESYRGQQKDLEQAEQALRAEIVTLESHCQDASLKVSTLQQKLLEAEESLRETGMELNEQKIKVSTLQQQLMEERMTLGVCNQELTAQLDRVNEVNAEKVTLSDEVERLRTDLQRQLAESTQQLQASEKEHQNAIEHLISKLEVERQEEREMHEHLLSKKDDVLQTFIQKEKEVSLQEREKLLRLCEEEYKSRQQTSLQQLISKYETQQQESEERLRKELQEKNEREKQNVTIQLNELTQKLIEANGRYTLSRNELQEQLSAWRKERQAMKSEYQHKLDSVQKEHEAQIDLVRLELERNNKNEVQAFEKKMDELHEKLLDSNSAYEKLKEEEQSRLHAWTREKEIMQTEFHDFSRAKRAELLAQHKNELEEAISTERSRHDCQLESMEGKIKDNEALILRIAELETLLADTHRLLESVCEANRAELVKKHEDKVTQVRMELVRNHQRDCERMHLTQAELEGQVNHRDMLVKSKQTKVLELEAELNNAEVQIKTLQKRIVEIETRSEEDLQRVVTSQNALEKDLSRRIQEKEFVVEELEKASKKHENLYKGRVQSLQETINELEKQLCELQDKHLALEKDADAKESALDLAEVTIKQLTQQLEAELVRMRHKSSLEGQEKVKLASLLERSLEQCAMSNEEVEILKLRLRKEKREHRSSNQETQTDSTTTNTMTSCDVSVPAYENIQAQHNHFAELKAQLHETLERVAFLESKRKSRAFLQFDSKQSDTNTPDGGNMLDCVPSSPDQSRGEIKQQLEEMVARYEGSLEEREELLELLSNPEEEVKYENDSGAINGQTTLAKLLCRERHVEETRSRILHLSYQCLSLNVEREAVDGALLMKLLDDRSRILMVMDEYYRRSLRHMHGILKEQDAAKSTLSVQLIEAQDQATSYAHQIASIETQLQTLPGINLEESKRVEKDPDFQITSKVDCVSILEEVRENLRNAEEYEAKMSAISKSTERLRERLASATEGIGSSDHKSERFELEIETLNQNLAMERNEKEELLLELKSTRENLQERTEQNKMLEEKARDSIEQQNIDIREHQNVQANMVELTSDMNRAHTELEALKAENVRLVFEIAEATDLAAVCKMDFEAMENQLKERSSELLAVKSQYKRDQEEHGQLQSELREQVEISSQQRNDEQGQLVAELGLLQQEYKELKNQFEVTSEQMESKDGIISEQNARIEELVGICKRLKALLKDMKEKHAADLQNRIDRQQAESKEAVDRAKEEIIRMENEARLQHEKLDQIKSKLETSQQLFLKQEADHLDRERHWKEEIQALCRANDDHCLRIEECNRCAEEALMLQKEEWQVRLHKLVMEQASLVEIVSNQTSPNLASRCASLEAQLEGILMEKEEKEREIMELHTQLQQSSETQRVDAEAQCREMNSLRMEVERKQANLEKEAQATEAARAALDTYKKRAHTALKKATKEAKESLQEATKRVTEMEQQVSDSNTRITCLEEELYEVRGSLERTTAKHEEEKLSSTTKQEKLAQLENLNTHQLEEIKLLRQTKAEEITDLEQQIESLIEAKITVTEQTQAIQSALESDLMRINEIVQTKSGENEALVQEIMIIKQELALIQAENSKDARKEDNQWQNAHNEDTNKVNAQALAEIPTTNKTTVDDSKPDPMEVDQPRLTISTSNEYKEESTASIVLQEKQELGLPDHSVLNVEYLRNIVIKYLSSQNHSEREHLIPVLATILKFTHEEIEKVTKSKKAQEASMLRSVMSIFGPQKSIQSPKPLAVLNHTDIQKCHSMEDEEEDEMSLLNPFASARDPLGW